jgi:sulfoxide reductase heme-binding subunit YedZ
MPNRAVVLLKVLVHFACLAPFSILAWKTYHDLTHPGAVALLGPDPTATLSHGTGFAALRILIISLAITPVRRLSKSLGWLIRFRRMLGFTRSSTPAYICWCISSCTQTSTGPRW